MRSPTVTRKRILRTKARTTLVIQLSRTTDSELMPDSGLLIKEEPIQMPKNQDNIDTESHPTKLLMEMKKKI